MHYTIIVKLKNSPKTLWKFTHTHTNAVFYSRKRGINAVIWHTVSYRHFLLWRDLADERDGNWWKQMLPFIKILWSLLSCSLTFICLFPHPHPLVSFKTVIICVWTITMLSFYFLFHFSSHIYLTVCLWWAVFVCASVKISVSCTPWVGNVGCYWDL